MEFPPAAEANGWILSPVLRGTFNWRKVAGKSLVHHRNRSQCGQSGLLAMGNRQLQLETSSRKNWSSEIIETFERHGFIWSEKWWHFDTMHFDYRPEIIAYTKSVMASSPESSGH